MIEAVTTRKVLDYANLLRAHRGVNASKRTTLGSIQSWILPLAFVVWLGFGIYMKLYGAPGPNTDPKLAEMAPIFIMMGGLGLVWWIYRLSAPMRNIKRVLRSFDPEMNWNITTFTSAGIRREHRLSTESQKWQSIPFVHESELGFSIWLADDTAIWIDATCFASQEEANAVADWARQGARKYKMDTKIVIPEASTSA